MSMDVTYKVYNRNKLLFKKKDVSCFSDIFNNNELKYTRVEVMLKTSVLNRNNEKFWLDLFRKIESKYKTYKDDEKNTWIVIKNKRTGRTKIALTILRYLWENDNHYDDVVPITKNILEAYPEMDPISAISIAASNTSNCNGWGHSLVSEMALYVPKVYHYRRYKETSVHGFCGTMGYKLNKEFSLFQKSENLRKIRQEKTDKFDIVPILNFYHIDENYNKLKIANG